MNKNVHNMDLFKRSYLKEVFRFSGVVFKVSVINDYSAFNLLLHTLDVSNN